MFLGSRFSAGTRPRWLSASVVVDNQPGGLRQNLAGLANVAFLPGTRETARNAGKSALTRHDGPTWSHCDPIMIPLAINAGLCNNLGPGEKFPRANDNHYDNHQGNHKMSIYGKPRVVLNRKNEIIFCGGRGHQKIGVWIDRCGDYSVHDIDGFHIGNVTAKGDIRALAFRHAKERDLGGGTFFLGSELEISDAGKVFSPITI